MLKRGRVTSGEGRATACDYGDKELRAARAAALTSVSAAGAPSVPRVPRLCLGRPVCAAVHPVTSQRLCRREAAGVRLTRRLAPSAARLANAGRRATGSLVSASRPSASLLCLPRSQRRGHFVPSWFARLSFKLAFWNCFFPYCESRETMFPSENCKVLHITFIL